MSAQKFSQRHKKALSRFTTVKDRRFSEQYLNNLDKYLENKEKDMIELEDKLDLVSEQKGKALKKEYFEKALNNEINFIVDNLKDLVKSTSNALDKPAKVVSNQDKDIVVGLDAEAIAKTFVYSKNPKSFVSRSEIELVAGELKDIVDFMSQKKYDKMIDAQNNKAVETDQQDDMSK